MQLSLLLVEEGVVIATRFLAGEGSTPTAVPGGIARARDLWE